MGPRNIVPFESNPKNYIFIAEVSFTIVFQIIQNLSHMMSAVISKY